MPELVGLTGEHLVFLLLCVLVEVFSNTTDVVRAGTRWEPAGNPDRATGFTAGWRLRATCRAVPRPGELSSRRRVYLYG